MNKYLRNYTFILLILKFHVIQGASSLIDTFVGVVPNCQQNASILIDNISWETIEERCLTKETGTKYTEWHLPDSWSPSISYLSCIRSQRKSDFFENIDKGENNYCFKFQFPINFSDIELNEHERILKYTKTNQNSTNIQMSDKLQQEKIYKQDHFLACLKVIHAFASDKLNLDHSKIRIDKKLNLRPESSTTKNLYVSKFNYSQICALNWLINYFSEKYVYKTAFIFANYLSVTNFDDKFIKLTINFCFDLPKLQEQDSSKKNYIKILDKKLIDLSTNLISLINMEDKQSKIFKQISESIDKAYVNTAEWRNFYANFINFIKIKISHESRFINCFNDLWLDTDGNIRSEIIFKKTENYEEYCVFFKDLKILQNVFLKKTYNINYGISLFSGTDLVTYKNEVDKLKLICEKMLSLTVKLHFLVKYKRVFTILDEIDHKFMVVRDIKKTHKQEIIDFSTMSFFKKFLSLKNAQVQKFKGEFKNLSTFDEISYNLKNLTPNVINLTKLLKDQFDFFNLLMKYLEFNSDELSTYSCKIDKIVDANNRIMNIDFGIDKYKAILNQVKLYNKTFNGKRPNFMDHNRASIILHGFETIQEIEEYSKFYGFLVEEESMLFCLYQQISIALLEYLGKANEIFKILST